MSQLRAASVGIVASGNVVVAFNPASVGTLAGQWDPSVSSSVHHTANAVDQLDDLSGNARHLTRSGGNRPTANTRTQNGLGVLDYDGTDDSLETASFTLAQPFTVFAVAKNDDGADSTNQCLFDINSGSLVRFVQKTSGNAWLMNAGTGITGGTADTAAAYYSGVFNNTSSKFFRNAVQLGATGAAGTNGITTGINLGVEGTATIWWDGWIGEVLLYSSALSDANRQLVEAYLAAKWAI